MLKMTEIELKLISDIDLFLFVETFSKANNIYMKSYGNSKPSKYIDI